MVTARQNQPARPMRGLTLVEVVAALVILGVLLALIVKASTQSNRQLALAEQRLHAAQEADRIIAGWFAAGVPIAAGFSGRLPGPPALYWETVERESAGLQQLGAKVVQLRMFADAGDASPGGAPGSGMPVLVVDLLASTLALPELPPEDPQAAATRPSHRDGREDPRLRQFPTFLPRP